MDRIGRKRSKQGSFLFGGRSTEEYQLSMDPQGDKAVLAEGVGIEGGYASSRCSVRILHEVVSNFDAYKRELVKSIGFAGILHFPCVKKLNRRFALWLMRSVNPELACLNIGDHINVRLTKYDVAHVLGLPAAGRRVMDDKSSGRNAKHSVLEKLTDQRFKEQRSVRVLQETIERRYMYPMTKEDEDIFRVSFTIFIVSVLLAPTAKHDYALVDYWTALVDPDSIQNFDWADYVMVKLLEAVYKLEVDCANNVKFPVISGCSIFLQVFYLDSLHLEAHMSWHNTFPRIREFSQDKISSMIMADKNFLRHVRGDDELLCSKLREPAGCVYSWASNMKESFVVSGHAGKQALWECAVSMAHLLGVPLESAGPLYIAAADFQDQINAGLLLNGTQVLKFMSVLVSIMMPYSRGFRYKEARAGVDGITDLRDALHRGLNINAEPCRLMDPAKCNSAPDHGSPMSFIGLTPSPDASTSCCEGGPSRATAVLRCVAIGDHVERSFKRAISSTDDLPLHYNVDDRVARAMSQFYLVARGSESSRGLDLNAFSGNHRTNGVERHPRCSIEVLHVPSPWDVGFSWLDLGDSEQELKLRLESLRDCKRSVIVHAFPKSIDVVGSDLMSQLVGECEIELDVFDLLLRGILQGDNELYSFLGDIRWRAFCETEFMAGVLAGTVDIKGGDYNCGLMGSYMMHVPRRCKLVFFPVLLQSSWVCFVWSIEEAVISVFEPSFIGMVPESRVQCIERTCFKLKVAIQSYFRHAFDVAHLSTNYFDMRLLTLPDTRVDRFNRSGVLAFMFCCCFDGVDIRQNQLMFDAERMAAKMLDLISRLEDNQGSFPVAPC